MNIGVLQPRPTISINKPIKISPKGNMYKIAIAHADQNGNPVRNYEIWTTKEAVQQHFNDTVNAPHNYQIKKFAKQMYESRLRSTNGKPQENGALYTSNQTIHGDPRLWPHTLSHPEIKV